MGRCSLLQGIFPTQELNLYPPCLLHRQASSLPLSQLGRDFRITDIILNSYWSLANELFENWEYILFNHKINLTNVDWLTPINCSSYRGGIFQYWAYDYHSNLTFSPSLYSVTRNLILSLTFNKFMYVVEQLSLSLRHLYFNFYNHFSCYVFIFLSGCLPFSYLLKILLYKYILYILVANILIVLYLWHICSPSISFVFQCLYIIFDWQG